MGKEIPTSKFTRQDFDRFRNNLVNETGLLESYFRDKRFCSRHNVGGFEVEAWLVDKNAMPNPVNERFLESLNNPLVVPELSLFNIELNVTPRILEKDALGRFRDDLQSTWEQCTDVAGKLDAGLMAIGIHPGITESRLNLDNMSSSPRYKALNEQVLALRKGLPMYLNIYGRELYDTTHYDVMLEAATTSFQIHIQIRQEKAVRVFNAALIASAPLVAVSANSPYVFGHDLWDESRIPVFEQSVDDGSKISKRVSFGDDYLFDSMFRCYQENLDKFPVLLPLNDDSRPEEFSHLRLHNGTIWRWNRPLIGFEKDGTPHLRLENRVVPSGPTLDDMIANAAFFWGMVRNLADQPDAPEDRLPFAATRKNFYDAAFNSFDSSLVWLDGTARPVKEILMDELIPRAMDGLLFLGMDEGDCEYYLGIIKNRVLTGQNGATWQRAWTTKHGRDFIRLCQVYLELQKSGTPVHEWPV